MELQSKETEDDKIKSTSGLAKFIYVIRSLIILGILFLFLKIEIESVFRVVLYQYYFLGIFVLATVILFISFVILDLYSFNREKKIIDYFFYLSGF